MKKKNLKTVLIGSMIAGTIMGCSQGQGTGNETVSQSQAVTSESPTDSQTETSSNNTSDKEKTTSETGQESENETGMDNKDGTNEDLVDNKDDKDKSDNNDNEGNSDSNNEGKPSRISSPGEGIESVFKKHDEYTDDITSFNSKAEKRSFPSWGTGMNAEEEKETILQMNRGFKDALLKKVMESGGNNDYYGYGNANILSDGKKEYVYDGNYYKAIMDAAEHGVISKDDAELLILSEILYTDELYDDLKNELIPKITAYLLETDKENLKDYKSQRYGYGVEDSLAINGGAAFDAFDAVEEDAMAEMPIMSFAAKSSNAADSIGISAAGGHESIPIDDTDFNTTEYNTIKENGFQSVTASPLSTFSIDVDTAGYTKVKYDILRGNEIVKDEVKIEELINYFDFDYSADRSGNEPFLISTAYTGCPWNKEHKILRIGIKADEADNPDTNFVMVADVSGSMLSLNKLPLALNAYADMLDGFDGDDTVSLMYYASSEGVILNGVPCSDKGRILDGLAETLFVAGGGTYGEAGLNTAYQMAEDHFIEGGVNRVLLATDGDFNIGHTSSSDMKDLVEKGMKKGVYLTILGYGFENLKDNKMETMAENGHGNYYFIGDIMDARKALVDEAESTLIPVADDVKIQVEFNPNSVQEYRLIGYESRLLNAEDFENDKVTASQIGAGKSVTVLYELVPAGAAPETSTPDLKYQANAASGDNTDICNVAVRYKGINSSVSGEESKLVEKKVLPESFKEVPDENTALAISIAEFGMTLRQSEFKGTACLSSAGAMAEAVAADTGRDDVQSYSELIKTLIDQS